MRTEVDRYLSSLYPSVEKIAQNTRFENLNKMAQQEGLNLSQLSPEQLELLAQEQLNAISGAEQQPEAEVQAGAIKEAQANLELADYMGRIMAHAFHQESGFIQKEAESFGSGFQGWSRNAGQHLLGDGGVAGKAHMYGQKAVNAVRGAGQAISQNKGLAGGAAAAGVAAGAGAHHLMSGDKKEKTAGNTAFDQLALQYAAQIVQQQGGDLAPLQQYAQYVEQQGQQEQAMQQQYEQQAQYQNQLAQQYAQQNQGQSQQPQQSATAQMMAQQGQQGYAQQGQGGFAQRPGQQRQQGFQPQQQQMQGQQFQQEQLQGQSAEAVKMASEMVQQQFNEALESAAWNILEQSGYQIDDGQQAQQQGQYQQQQMGQQQMGGQPQMQQQFQQPMQ